MAEDLEEIKGRLGQLERYVNLLESRVDAQESAMKLYTAGRKPAAQSSAQDTASAQQGENDLLLAN